MKQVLVALALAASAQASIRLFWADLFMATGFINNPDPDGGLTSADQHCMSLAGNHFVALMSDQWTHGIHRIRDGEPIINYFDNSVIANIRADLFTDDPDNVPVTLQNKVLSFSGQVAEVDQQIWTGTNFNGFRRESYCRNWKTDSASYRGEAGSPDKVDHQWISVAAVDCNLPTTPTTSFYCVEQKDVACVFITNDPVDLSVASDGKMGVEKLDDVCQKAYSKGKPVSAQFVALVSTSSVDAYDRFPEEEGAYTIINPAGQLINTLQYDFFASGSLFGKRITMLDGHLPNTDTRVWTGTHNVITADNAEYGVSSGKTCIDWNSLGLDISFLASQTATHGDTQYTDDRMAGNAGEVSCTDKLNLICVQTTSVLNGDIHGDPHFAGFDGSRYNFDGLDGEIFHIISDTDFLLNAQFTEMEIFGTQGTWMTKLGFRSGKDTIVFDPSFGLLVNNEDLIKSGTEIVTENFHITLSWKGDRVQNIVVRAAGYEITVKPVQYQPGKIYLDVQTSILSLPVKPHGVLGQTARYLVEGADPKPVRSKAKNAEDLLEGVFTDYMVKDGILGVDSRFNTFEGLVTGRGRIQTRSTTVVDGAFIPLRWSVDGDEVAHA